MKMSKKIMATLVASVLSFNCFSSSLVAFAETSEVWDRKDDFPTIYSMEWDSMTSDEKREAYNSYFLNASEMPTYKLAVDILDRTLTGKIRLYDNLYDGYCELKKDNFAITELCSRDDAFNVLKELYDDYTIPEKKIVDYSSFLENSDYKGLNLFVSDPDNRNVVLDDSRVINNLEFIEFLLFDLSENSEGKRTEFLDSFSKKLTEKNNSEYFNNRTAVETINDIHDSGLELDIDIFTSLAGLLSTSYYTIYTPDGVAVSCEYSATLTYDDINGYTQQLIDEHATLVSNAPNTCNCHSYSWLSTLYPSVYQHLCLYNLSAFTSDSHYTSSSTPVQNAIVYNPGHSGIVLATNMNNPYNNNIPEPYIVNKWGGGPIVMEFLSFSPMSGGYTYYKYNN